MSDMLSLIMAFFQWKGWTPLKNDNPNMVYALFEGKNGKWKLIALCHPERPIIALYSLFPLPVPKERQQDLLTLIAMINDGMIVGNFEFTFEHQEVKYRTSLDATGMHLDLKMANPLAYYNLLAMDQYYACLHACIVYGRSPAESMKYVGKKEEDIE